MADAKGKNRDRVITMGETKSFQRRAVAATRRVWLQPRITLRMSGPNDSDPGLVGNMLVDCVIGARIHLVSETKFQAKGEWKLARKLRDGLEEQGKLPYAFPSGGSITLVSWGYVEAVREVAPQAAGAELHFNLGAWRQARVRDGGCQSIGGILASRPKVGSRKALLRRAARG